MKSILLTCLVAATAVTCVSASPKAKPQSLLDLDLALAAQEQQQLEQRPTLLDLVLAAAEQEAAIQQQQQQPAQPTLLDLVLAAADAQQQQQAAPEQPQPADSSLDIAEARRVLLGGGGGGIIGGGQRRIGDGFPITSGWRRQPNWGVRPGLINRRIPIRRPYSRVG